MFALRPHLTTVAQPVEDFVQLVVIARTEAKSAGVVCNSASDTLYGLKRGLQSGVRDRRHADDVIAGSSGEFADLGQLGDKVELGQLAVGESKLKRPAEGLGYVAAGGRRERLIQVGVQRAENGVFGVGHGGEQLVGVGI